MQINWFRLELESLNARLESEQAKKRLTETELAESNHKLTQMLLELKQYQNDVSVLNEELLDVKTSAQQNLEMARTEFDAEKNNLQV